tara:strand:+ start:813 stop:1022 length:210 start_codon:yes stop_codon:yes gene_type:complete
MSITHPQSETSDPIGELHNLVEELRDVGDTKEFFEHLSAINEKIDLLKECVERMCESTAGCVAPLNEQN